MNGYSISPAHLETNQCTCCNMISCTLYHARTYPVATQKGVADLCLYQLQCMCKCIHTGIKNFTLRSYVAIANKAVCALNKHEDQDDDKMNTLVFINLILIKIFPTLIDQNFPLSKFCVIRHFTVAMFSHSN